MNTPFSDTIEVPLPTLSQMRSMLQLANELHAIRSAQRRVDQLLAGLLQLLSAEWATCTQVASLAPPTFARTSHLARGPRERSLRGQLDPAADRAAIALLRDPPQTNSPTVRAHVASPGPALAAVSRHALHSLCRGMEAGRGWSMLIVRRSTPFDARETMILRLLHPQTEWAIHLPGPRTADPLPRRATAVLHLLLDGHSEKEVARRVGRSTHTVHTHIKRVYRHYGVTSRAELLSHFVR